MERKEVLIGKKTLKKRIKQLAEQITKDYEGEWMFKQDPTFSYGFFISETANLKDAYQVCYITSGDTSHFSEDKSTGLVSFNYTLMYKQGSLNNIIIPEEGIITFLKSHA